eukprot:PhM_4_TR1760/c0_g1_i1/m.38261
MAVYFCKPFEVCGRLLFPEDRPSPIFVVFTSAINGIPLIMNAVRLVDRGDSDRCESEDSLRLWLMLGIATQAINILFAFYIHMRYRAKLVEDYEERQLHQQQREQPPRRGLGRFLPTPSSSRSARGPSSGRASAFRAASQLLLYDVGVCVYFIVLIWEMVWIAVSRGKIDDEPTCNDLPHNLNVTAVCIIVYIAVGGFVIVFSLLTECCREPRWQQRYATDNRHMGHQTLPPAPPVPAPGPPQGVYQYQMQPVSTAAAAVPATGVVMYSYNNTNTSSSSSSVPLPSAASFEQQPPPPATNPSASSSVVYDNNNNNNNNTAVQQQQQQPGPPTSRVGQLAGALRGALGKKSASTSKS